MGNIIKLNYKKLNSNMPRLTGVGLGALVYPSILPRFDSSLLNISAQWTLSEVNPDKKANSITSNYMKL